MRYFAPVLLTILIAAALTSAALGQADYAYTFAVPVNVSQLPTGATVHVNCNLYQAATGEGAPLNVLPPFPAWPQAVSTNGKYSGPPLTVHVSARSNPGSYRCWLVIADSSRHLISPINADMGVPLPSQAGWTGTMFTIGTLP
jgi:hypothetical protein